MRKFVHINPESIDQAASYLERYGRRASLIAGGTDLLGKLKDEIMPGYPEAVINLKSIPGLDFIEETGDGLRIGALTRLEDIAHHPAIKRDYLALAQAAWRTASPHIREMGTIGGNICQDIRCWYYRNPNNRFPCLRKGGGRCYAIEGDNRYHSIFGSTVKGGCLAVHPSDTAPALVALDAVIQTSKRAVKAQDFFTVGVEQTTVLDPDEMVTEIRIPKPAGDARSAFLKFAARQTIDFPIVNCAARIILSEGKVSGARICLNAVYVVPLRATGAEEALTGRALDDESAAMAAAAAVSHAKPVRNNQYMVPIAETMVKRTLSACG